MIAAEQRRLEALNPKLRAWAREEPLVRDHLASYVRGRQTLGEALAHLGHTFGRDEVHRRAEPPPVPGREMIYQGIAWCARRLPCGLGCGALASELVVEVGSTRCWHACGDCARWYERTGTGRVHRA